MRAYKCGADRTELINGTMMFDRLTMVVLGKTQLVELHHTLSLIN